MRYGARIALLLPILLLHAPAGPAIAAGTPEVAALQVALRAKGLYRGAVDGVPGPATAQAIRALQHRARVRVDGIAGPVTRRALGRLGRPELGRRLPRRGSVGWDVAQLQFMLAAQGFPSGPFDGRFGRRTAAALRRFQRWAGLDVDGRPGPTTIARLRAPPPVSPVRLAWPVRAPLGDRFGPRGVAFHAGLDFPAASGASVTAAGAGLVTYAGWRAGGWGNVVAVAHGGGVRTLYAHLSRVRVRVGDQVGTGFRIGLVGSTGRSTGPHLHFELRVRGAAVDPLTALR